MTRIRVVLVDDHAIVRTGLKAVLAAAPEVEVVGEASGGVEAVALLAHTPADVVVMDISMADGDGIAATRTLTKGNAGAQQVDILLRHKPGVASLEVSDDGRGFDVRRAEERRPGMGLFSMRERVALVNGRLTVTSSPGRGTRIVATVPLTN